MPFLALVLTATFAGTDGQASVLPQKSAAIQSAATQSTAKPPPAVRQTGRVTDAANILSVAQRSDLTIKLAELERATRHQMVVVTVLTLGGRDVAPFTRDLGSSWGVGRTGVNDGVVLLVAPKEQMVWIAVGKGLEGKLTNQMCQQILDETMMPRFRAGHLADGIKAGTDALIARLR